MSMRIELSGPFGRYTIVRKLGEGGMGAVYLAEDPQLGRRVALKVPLLDAPEDVQRFQREARAAAAIEHHAHVCPIYEVGSIDGIHYLTMPFLEGVPLTQLIDREHGLSVPQAVAIVHTLALALQTLHDRGLMHRDLKPANVMLKHGREPILMDFGLARSYAGDLQRMTSTGKMMGTPAYMSPEQINGDMKALGPATDVYGLGVILFELLTGQRPFDAPSLEQLYYQMFQETRPKPSQVRAEIPAALDAVCVRALAKKPGDRFASMADFAAALAPWLAPPTAPSQPAVPPATQRITCPHCHKPLELAASQWGKRVRCSACQQPFTVNDVATLPVRPPLPVETVTPSSDRTARRELRRSQSLGVWLLAGVAALSLLGCLVFGWLAVVGGPGTTTSSAKQQTASNESERARPVAGPPNAKKLAPEPPADDPKEAIKEAPAVPQKQPTKPPFPRPNDPEQVTKPRREPLPKILQAAITNSIGMKLVLISAGKFMMGSPETEKDRGSDEHPHEVAITRPFHLGVYEVTQEEYEQVMGNNPSYFSATGGGKEKVARLDTKRFPVESVSWEDAVGFCRKLSELPAEKAAGRLYRLPTEAEWEYACRGRAPVQHPFHFGPRLSSAQANFDGNYPYGDAPKGKSLQRTTAVGSYPANVFGLHDMHGNVWEWCQDWYGADYYKNSPPQDPSGSEGGSDRVFRGGSWTLHGQRCRAAYRSGYSPSYRSDDLGFRVARVPSGR